jgi:hypothetical protein
MTPLENMTHLVTLYVSPIFLLKKNHLNLLHVLLQSNREPFPFDWQHAFHGLAQRTEVIVSGCPRFIISCIVLECDFFFLRPFHRAVVDF